MTHQSLFSEMRLLRWLLNTKPVMVVVYVAIKIILKLASGKNT
jgi:hypothetical protein